jgi:hypothetical protein
LHHSLCLPDRNLESATNGTNAYARPISEETTLGGEPSSAPSRYSIAGVRHQQAEGERLLVEARVISSATEAALETSRAHIEVAEHRLRHPLDGFPVRKPLDHIMRKTEASLLTLHTEVGDLFAVPALASGGCEPDTRCRLFQG